MSADDVAVTGVGLLTPLGATAGETAEAWRSGRAAVRAPIPELAGTPLEGMALPVLPGFDAERRLGGRKMMKFMSNVAVLGCLAAREAFREARAAERFDPVRTGIYAGVGITPIELTDVRDLVLASIDKEGRFSSRLLGERGLGASNPLVAFRILPNIPPAIISILEGIRGPNCIFTPWEGQTGAAFFEAWLAVSTGEVDCALAGGADQASHPSNIAFLCQTGIVQQGETPSAGAGYLVLERMESALRDGVRIHAILSRVDLTASDEGVSDPLAGRMGRTFAAAPAILAGLAAMGALDDASMCGTDMQRIAFSMEGR